MKRMISALLVLVFVLSLIGTSAMAAGGFDKSVFENSRKFSRFGFGNWSLIGGYEKSFQGADVKVRAFLFDNYVSEGWGPELRIEFYDTNHKRYDEITAFKASVDGVVYNFDKLDYNDDPDVHGGYAFGGRVYQAFMADIIYSSDVMFLITHTDWEGDSIDSVIEHVHTGDLSNLIEMAKYLSQSNAWKTDSDPDGNDEYYGAYIS